MAAALRIEALHKSFGKNEILKGIDLTVAEHEVVCLIGASGSGKSTLLRCINLLERIDSGRIVLAGDEITGHDADLNRLRRRIGFAVGFLEAGELADKIEHHIPTGWDGSRTRDTGA